MVQKSGLMTSEKFEKSLKDKSIVGVIWKNREDYKTAVGQPVWRPYYHPGIPDLVNFELRNPIGPLVPYLHITRADAKFLPPNKGKDFRYFSIWEVDGRIPAKVHKDPVEYKNEVVGIFNIKAKASGKKNVVAYLEAAGKIFQHPVVVAKTA